MRLRSACAHNIQCNFVYTFISSCFPFSPVNIGTKFTANANRSLIGRLIKGFIELIFSFAYINRFGISTKVQSISIE